MSNQDNLKRLKELVEKLNEASEAYYAKDDEIMSNFEYDALYDELVSLEKETGVILSNSPTVNVGYEAVDALPKEAHEKPMLSLGKTKDRGELRDWLNGHPAILSWKLDGLTVVLTYQNGKLFKAVTRGNGEIGEVITQNALQFINVPFSIPFKGEMIVRGEAVISYSDFEKINADLPDGEKYKNPRNLCSGSVRQLDSKITAGRHVRFIAFSLVKASENGIDVDLKDSREAGFRFLQEQGLEVVERVPVTEETILSEIEGFAKRIIDYEIPSDGLVLSLEELAYGASLGRTAKFPRDSIAFKWADELQETTLLEVEWSASRTGLINPVAIFEPVELEGTTVSRASVHNVSIVRSLKLGIGDRITVYKANMIIPQIQENLTCSDSLEIPKVCPVCGGSTKIHQTNDVQSLYCENEDCPAKKIKAFTLFVSRDAFNVEGLSESTMEKFIDMGFVKEFSDLFSLDRYKDAIIGMEGFGEKSYSNMIEGIEKARETSVAQLIYALGIENIGVANAKVIAKHFQNDFEKFQNASLEELSEIEGVGEIIANGIIRFFENTKNQACVEHLLKEITLVIPRNDSQTPNNLEGMVFVVTGSLNHFENRDALKEEIEARGGKVTGSVTGKSVCLINNDVTSNSTKNKKAKELGVPILSEEDFMARYLI